MSGAHDAAEERAASEWAHQRDWHEWELAERERITIKDDRDTMAATLRGLLLAEASLHITAGRRASSMDDHLSRSSRLRAHTRRLYADAALALVLALLIGGEHV